MLYFLKFNFEYCYQLQSLRDNIYIIETPYKMRGGYFVKKQIALIAGEGTLPVVIANRLTDIGRAPIVYSIREHIGELSKYSRDIVNIARPDFGFIIKDMNKRGVKSIIMAGTVSKTLAFKPSLFDITTQKFLAGLIFRDDHSLLGAIVEFLEKAGFEVLSYKNIIPDLIAGIGHIAGRKPTKEELNDVKYGFSICRVTVPLSFGQTIIVHKKSVVAIEAMEGTDAALFRAGSLCKGGTVVKMMRLDQDERYDIPTVGPKTIEHMSEVKLNCLALHAGSTLIMEPEKFKVAAEKAKIAVIGVDPCQSL